MMKEIQEKKMVNRTLQTTEKRKMTMTKRKKNTKLVCSESSSICVLLKPEILSMVARKSPERKVSVFPVPWLVMLVGRATGIGLQIVSFCWRSDIAQSYACISEGGRGWWGGGGEGTLTVRQEEDTRGQREVAICRFPARPVIFVAVPVARPGKHSCAPSPVLLA